MYLLWANVINQDDPENPKKNPCEHILYIYTDESCEYRSSAYLKYLKDHNLDDEDLEDYDDGINGFSDRLDIPNSFKVAMCQGAPSFFGVYIGYAKSLKV